MELNDKMVKEIAKQLGISGGRNMNRETLNQLTSKSDSELEREILRVKEQLKANNVSYEKQLSMLRSVAPMMDAKQRARLQKIIGLLKD